MLNCCQFKNNENDKIFTCQINEWLNAKFSTENSSDQILYCNITMLSSIGAMALSSDRIMNINNSMALNHYSA